MRKGLLASLTLVLGHTAAQAQYWPAQQPVYQQPNQVPVWIVPQPAPGATYHPQAPRQAYPTANTNYLPPGYFPASTMRAVAPPAPATPVPAEPIRTQPAVANGAVAATTVARPVTTTGPAHYFATLPATAPAREPVEPVVYHRDHCEKWWVGVHYLMGWMRQGPLGVPLVTTGSVADAVPGAIGQPGTVVLFGDSKIDYRMFQGVRGE